MNASKAIIQMGPGHWQAQHWRTVATVKSLQSSVTFKGQISLVMAFTSLQKNTTFVMTCQNIVLFPCIADLGDYFKVGLNFLLFTLDQYGSSWTTKELLSFGEYVLLTTAIQCTLKKCTFVILLKTHLGHSNTNCIRIYSMYIFACIDLLYIKLRYFHFRKFSSIQPWWFYDHQG